jgi:adenylate cyclase
MLYLGFPDQAQAWIAEGLRMAETMRHPLALCNTLSVAVTVEAFHRNTGTIIEMAEKMLFHADEHGLPYYEGIAHILRGWARAMQGAVDEGCAEMRAGLAAHRNVETEQQRAHYLVMLAEALSAAGRLDEGLQVLEESLETMNRTDERCCEAEWHRIKGELLMRMQNMDAAEICFRRALEVARTQGTRGFELRAATGIARLLRTCGRPEDARAMLASAYEWFTEGFDTPDLQAAKLLLGEFS